MANTIVQRRDRSTCVLGLLGDIYYTSAGCIKRTEESMTRIQSGTANPAKFRLALHREHPEVCGIRKDPHHDAQR